MRQVKIGIALATGGLLVVAMVIAVTAWIKGGVQPAHMVEVPVHPGHGQAGGA